MAEQSDREAPVPDAPPPVPPPPGVAAPDDPVGPGPGPAHPAAGWPPPTGAASGGPPPNGWVPEHRGRPADLPGAAALPYGPPERRPRRAADRPPAVGLPYAPLEPTAVNRPGGPQGPAGPPPAGGPAGWDPWRRPPPPPADVPFLDQPGSVPATRGDGGMWFVFALVGFIAGQVAGLLTTLLAAAIAGDAHEYAQLAKLQSPPEWYIASSLIGLWFGFFLGPFIASMARGTRHFVHDLGLRFRPIDAAGVAVGFGGQLLVAAMYAPFAQHLKNFNGPTTKLTGASHGGGFLVIAVLTVVGAPFFEELFFRGLLLKGLIRWFAPSRPGRSAARTVAIVAGIVLDGLLFGLAHAELVQLAGLATFGAILAAISYRTGRLGMNIVAHGTFNLVAVVAVAASRGVVFH